MGSELLGEDAENPTLSLEIKEGETKAASMLVSKRTVRIATVLIIVLFVVVIVLGALLAAHQGKTGANSPLAKSCSELKSKSPRTTSGVYKIDPDGKGGLAPFTVYCDMDDDDLNELPAGVTVISHDSESRTHVQGYDNYGSYSRCVRYNGASLTQLASLIKVSSYCEQYIKYECYGSILLREPYGWWVSRDSRKMSYWGGATPGSGKCACGMTNSCADPSYGCNCDKNDSVWRQDSGLLTNKTQLPVSQLRFGDTDIVDDEQGYHTLGKLKCYGMA